VPARSPFDGAAVVAHAAGAAHHRFQVRHFERNVIKRRSAGEAEHDAVMIGIAGQKAQPPGGVGEPEAERVAITGEGSVRVAIVESDV